MQHSHTPGRAGLALAVVGIICLAGCGGGSKPTAPVSGTVTLNGQPLAGIVVTFQPIATSGADAGVGSSGVTGPDGRYTLKLATVGGKEGAVVGKHTVRFQAAAAKQDPSSDAPVKVEKDPIPAKYNEQPATFDVPAGGTTSADFAL